MTSSKIDSLKLMSGSSIALQEIGISIRQPKIKDISILGEEEFYIGLSYFLVNKDKMSLEIDISDFDLFNYICNTNPEIKEKVYNILTLTIQDIDEIEFQESFIMIKAAGHECIIDEPKFLIIKETFTQIFCLEQKNESTLNPADEAARRIAEKIEKRRQKIANQNGAQKETSIFSNFISILSIGTNSINISECLELTVFQIYNLVKRFNLHQEYEMQMQALMQGAENIDLVDWTKQI